MLLPVSYLDKWGGKLPILPDTQIGWKFTYIHITSIIIFHVSANYKWTLLSLYSALAISYLEQIALDWKSDENIEVCSIEDNYRSLEQYRPIKTCDLLTTLPIDQQWFIWDSKLLQLLEGHPWRYCMWTLPCMMLECIGNSIIHTSDTDKPTRSEKIATPELSNSNVFKITV